MLLSARMRTERQIFCQSLEVVSSSLFFVVVTSPRLYWWELKWVEKVPSPRSLQIVLASCLTYMLRTGSHYIPPIRHHAAMQTVIVGKNPATVSVTVLQAKTRMGGQWAILAVCAACLLSYAHGAEVRQSISMAHTPPVCHCDDTI